MKATVQKNIVETFKKLNESVSSFSQEEFNIAPYKGSWTAGQTVEHIIKACSGYPKLFAGNKKNTIRKPDDNIKELEGIFLNFNIKMDSPDFLKPEIIDYNKNSQTLALLKIESELLNSCETYDLTLTCLDFQLPHFEQFTIYEWISFALFHAQRHTKQLNAILHYMTEL
ncbi:DinB family protein [Flavobacterium sp. ANB]|uniref:DinB family protein n=1 Tax=unclassified Flavobacterium TaxID=196869 RepID=UPI0012BA1084|nr:MULTISPECIES: DinB family protein [unclassified Flavobacterium]MBF4516662.1 DinB family protein [Flavobacterium sp. ANB]MTD69442.1 DinB family protein [Flavobacterium sp. LC2016-13]